jgi:transposase-like protein
MSNTVFNYHPDYGLPDEVRLRAVFDAKAMKVKTAAKTNKVSVASIYKWRKKLEQDNRS